MGTRGLGCWGVYLRRDACVCGEARVFAGPQNLGIHAKLRRGTFSRVLTAASRFEIHADLSVG